MLAWPVVVKTAKLNRPVAFNSDNLSYIKFCICCPFGVKVSSKSNNINIFPEAVFCPWTH